MRSGTENINKTVFQALYSAIAKRASRDNKYLPYSERACVTAEASYNKEDRRERRRIFQ